MWEIIKFYLYVGKILLRRDVFGKNTRFAISGLIEDRRLALKKSLELIPGNNLTGGYLRLLVNLGKKFSKKTQNKRLGYWLMSLKQFQY
jgi:hypothetical protein